jgi:DNA-binding transcriptional regulator GbsR (MarR family)
VKTDVKQLSLSKEEKRYINLFGEYYEKRGLPHAMGQIYSVLAYKARTPEEGMTQRDIAQLVDRSVSAVSRLLNSLVEMGLGLYTEKVNERGRRERRYYLAASIADITVQRLGIILLQNVNLHESISKIIDQMSGTSIKKNKELVNHLTQMQEMIKAVNKFYEDAIEKSKTTLNANV